jgi:rRNA-processing protein FCF1
MAQSPHEVLLDTNVLVLPEQFKIDLLSEIERVLGGRKFILITLRCLVEEELKRTKGGGLAKEFMEKNDVGVKDCTGHGDACILGYAKEKDGIIVCTNDSELRKNLRGAGIPVIFMRGKSKLALQGYIK